MPKLPKYVLLIAVLFCFPTIVFADHDQRDPTGLCHGQAGVAYFWADQVRPKIPSKEKAVELYGGRLAEQGVKDEQIWAATKKGIELAWADPASDPMEVAKAFYEWCVGYMAQKKGAGI
jgi:hypothetical protein